MSMLFITEMAVLSTISNMKGPSSLYSAPNSGEIPFHQALYFYSLFGFFLHTGYMNKFGETLSTGHFSERDKERLKSTTFSVLLG